MVNDIGFRIYRLRRDAKLSQDELAEKLGVDKKTISDWEDGKSAPSVEDILILADIFSVTSDYLLGRETESKSEIIPAPKKTEKEMIPLVNLFYLVYPFVLLILYSIKINIWVTEDVLYTQNSYQIRNSSGRGIFFLVRISLFTIFIRITSVLSVSLPSFRKNSLDQLLLRIGTLGLTLFHIIFCFTGGIFSNIHHLLPFVLIPIFGVLFAFIRLIRSLHPNAFLRFKDHIRHSSCLYRLSLPLFFCIEYFIVFPLSSFYTRRGVETLWDRFSHTETIDCVFAWITFIVGVVTFIIGILLFLLCNRKKEKSFRITLMTFRSVFTALVIVDVILRDGNGVGVFSCIFFPVFFTGLLVAFYFLNLYFIKRIERRENKQ